MKAYEGTLLDLLSYVCNVCFNHLNSGQSFSDHETLSKTNKTCVLPRVDFTNICVRLSHAAFLLDFFVNVFLRQMAYGDWRTKLANFKPIDVV